MWNYRIIVTELRKAKGKTKRKVGVINLETSEALTRPQIIKKVKTLFPKFDGVKVLECQVEPVRGKSLFATAKRNVYA